MHDFGKQLRERLCQEFFGQDASLKQWFSPARVFDMHHRSHIEELVALMDAMMHGERFFRGSSASIEFHDAGMFTPDGRPVRELENEGHVPLGLWGGLLDEHRLTAQLQEHNISAAMLTSVLIGSYSDLAWRPIVDYVSENDSKGGSSPWELANILLKLHDYLTFQARMAKIHRDVDVSEYKRFLVAFWFVRVAVQARYLKNLGLFKDIPETTGFWSEPSEYVSHWLIHHFALLGRFERQQPESSSVGSGFCPHTEAWGAVLSIGVVETLKLKEHDRNGDLERLSFVLEFGKSDRTSKIGSWDLGLSGCRHRALFAMDWPDG